MATKNTSRKKTQKNRSRVKNPCKRVWEIADSMPDASRKEVIEACVKKGINFFTARRQYQEWYTANYE